MKKNEFIKKISSFVIKNSLINFEGELFQITADSRDAKKGSVFFCQTGKTTDGHKYAEKALLNGAEIVVGENPLDLNSYIQVTSVNEVLNFLLPYFYDYPDKKMKMFAVTGTNGKTSTTFMIENILKDHIDCGVIGTLGYRYGKTRINAVNTTPMNWKWYNLLNEMKINDTELILCEISSHALKENRIGDTEFDVAIFTNLSRDHLDFHNNMEEYYQAKKKLFIEHMKDSGVVVINIDDKYGLRLYEEVKSTAKTLRISETCEDAEFKFSIIQTSSTGSKVFLKKYNTEIKIPYAGKFNIYNMLSAIAASSVFFSIEKVFESSKTKTSIPGRLERINKSSVYVDYAHSPDALKNVITTLRNIISNDGKIITVFGAGGDRDSGKRSKMGLVVTELSDIAILTNDNPRSENPDCIIEDILEECEMEKVVVEIIKERKEAIRRAIDLAGAKDVVLVAGKGAENYQITLEGKRHFSDREEIEKYIGELKNVYSGAN